MTLLAPRIGNDVSYVRQIPDDLDIAWQAQYLVRLPGDFTFSAHLEMTFQSSTGVVRCSTGVVQSSTGVVLCSSTGVVQSSTGVGQSSTGVVLCSTE